MGWIESGAKCEIHQDECRQPGVCSSCLRERLTQASTRSIARSYSSSSSLSSSPPYSTVSYFSSTNSPTTRGHHHRRWRRHHIHKNGSAVMSSISYGLKKSKSIAAGVRRRNKADQDVDVEKRDKKTGFWSKIINGKKV